MQLPKPTYFIPLAGSLGSWSAEQWASGKPWFTQVPFPMIFWGSVAFAAGLILQDLYNSQSWIRSYLRDFRRIFAIQNANFPHQSTPDIEWKVLRVTIQMVRRCKATLSVRVTENIGKPHQLSFVLDGDWEEMEHRAKSRLISMDLATFPIKAYDENPAGYDVWSSELQREFQQGQKGVFPGSALIEITARSWRGDYTERLLFVWPSTTGPDTKAVGLIKEGPLLSLEGPEVAKD